MAIEEEAALRGAASREGRRPKKRPSLHGLLAGQLPVISGVEFAKERRYCGPPRINESGICAERKMSGVSIAILLSAAARLMVGSILVAAGISKFRQLEEFTLILSRFPVVRALSSSRRVGLQLARILCVLELALGLAFIVGLQLRLVVAGILLLLLGFTFGLGVAVVRQEKVSCGCFGSSRAAEVTERSLWRNLVIICLALIGVINREASLDALLTGDIAVSDYIAWSAVSVQLALLGILLVAFLKLRSVPRYIRRVPQYDDSSLGLVWAGAPERGSR